MLTKENIPRKRSEYRGYTIEKELGVMKFRIYEKMSDPVDDSKTCLATAKEARRMVDIMNDNPDMGVTPAFLDGITFLSEK